MRLGVIGYGDKGADLICKLQQGNHECVVFNGSPIAEDPPKEKNIAFAVTIEHLIQLLPRPRIIWITVPGEFVDQLLVDLMHYLNTDDILVDGGNSYYLDDIARAKKVAEKGVHYLDCGVCGGKLGLLKGYHLLIGGNLNVVNKLTDIFNTLIQDSSDVARQRNSTFNSPDTAHPGYLHCGSNGAGHLVKSIRNGIEYGLMVSYAQGMKSNRHGVTSRWQDQSTSQPKGMNSSLDLRAIAEVWSRGGSYLDVMVAALLKESELKIFNLPSKDEQLETAETRRKKNNLAKASSRTNWRSNANTVDSDEQTRGQRSAEQDDQILFGVGFNSNGEEELQSSNLLLQQMIRHRYLNVCMDYLMALNQ